MIDPNTKIEHGGSVKISGLWHAVEISSIPGKLCCKIGAYRWVVGDMLSVIEAYEPPKDAEGSPYEWVSIGLWNPWNPFSSLEAARVFKQALLQRYGDPTIRTYAGEDAEQYGLTGDSHVLYFDEHVDDGGDGDAWARSRFKNLETGNQWRKQPVLPNEKDSDHE